MDDQNPPTPVAVTADDFGKNPLASKQVQTALATLAVGVVTKFHPPTAQFIRDNFETILLVAPAVLMFLRTKTVEPIVWKKLVPSVLLSFTKKF